MFTLTRRKREMMTTDNDNNESGLSDEELAAQQADEAAAQALIDADSDPDKKPEDGLDPDADPDNKPEPEPEPKKELPKGVQKRIDKITRQKHDAERRIQALEQELGQRPEVQPASTKAPTPDDFEDDFDGTKYIDALTDWKVNQAMQGQATQTAETQKRAHQEEVFQDWDSRRQAMNIKGVTAYEDYEEVALESHDFMTAQMVNIITDSEIGHDIAYYLGENHDEAEKIFKLHPQRQAVALTRLEVKLASKPAKKISKAPDPITTVGAKGASSTTIDPKKDWVKWAKARNEEEFGR